MLLSAGLHKFCEATTRNGGYKFNHRNPRNGVHKFNHRNTRNGGPYLCIFWTGNPAVPGLIEGILILGADIEIYDRECAD